MDEIDHYEEYTDGVFSREVSLEEHQALTDVEFSRNRYIPVYQGTTLSVKKLPDGKLEITYRDVDYRVMG